MSQYNVYRLFCTSQSYFRSVTPPGIHESILDADIQVVHSGFSFYSLSEEPATVFEDAVLHLIEKRRVFQREQVEGLFDTYHGEDRPDWSKAEFIVARHPDAVEETVEQHIKYTEMLMRDAARDHLDMVQGIQLQVVEVICPEHCATIDKAKRFITNRDMYMSAYHYASGTSTHYAVQRELAQVSELVKQRLLGRDHVMDELNKLVFDLTQRFPDDFGM